MLHEDSGRDADVAVALERDSEMLLGSLEGLDVGGAGELGCFGL